MEISLCFLFLLQCSVNVIDGNCSNLFHAWQQNMYTNDLEFNHINSVEESSGRTYRPSLPYFLLNVSINMLYLLFGQCFLHKWPKIITTPSKVGRSFRETSADMSDLSIQWFKRSSRMFLCFTFEQYPLISEYWLTITCGLL